jgi:hypothetical protein
MPKLDAMARAARVVDAHSWSDVGWPRTDVAVDFSDSGSAIVALREDLDLRNVDMPLRFAQLEFDPVRAALFMLDLAVDTREGIQDDEARFYASHLQRIARATHVLGVATERIRVPRVELDKFEGGQVHGTAVLVDLANQEIAGAFSYLAVNRDHITGTDATIHTKLYDDLRGRWGAALLKGIREEWPNTTPPVTFGYLGV